MKPSSLIFALATAVALAVPPFLAAAAGTLDVTDAFVREPIGSMRTAAAYLRIANRAGAPDRLMSASTPAADKAVLHGHEIDAQGIARMRPVPSVEVPAGGTVEFKPGGLHIMLMGLKGGLKPGATVHITLTFEKAGQIEVAAPVMPMSAASPAGMDRGTMGHGTMKEAPKATN